MEILFTSEGLLTLFTLTTLEIILGIDNVVFLAILVNQLPPEKRNSVRVVGLSLALVLRILMLFGASWLIKLTNPLFVLYNFEFSGRTLLLIIGGGFLIIKSFFEVYELLHEKPIATKDTPNKNNNKYWLVIFQIIFIDLILSFDSIISAVGITDHLIIIIIAIFITIITMLVAVKPIGEFIQNHLSVKVIALCFITFVGIMLVSNGFGFNFSKNYLYVTLFFSLGCETINILVKNKKLRDKNEKL